MEESLVQRITDYTVGYMTLSLIIAGIAQCKNRDGFVWWVLAIIFGPLVLFWLLTLDKIPDEQFVQRQIVIGDTKVELGPGKRIKVNEHEVISRDGRVNT